MKVYVYCLIAALLGTPIACGQVGDRPLSRSVAEDGGEVLTRGPVHEAFAGTITFDPEPGVVVDKPVPEAIEELPPEQKPEGTNVAWIPGYWGWDDERSDFLWVSGIWRSLPPDRQWVSGYWATSGRDSQWTSGYWADAQASEIDYLPEPPQTVEAGPNIEAPSVDHTWLPGCWIWQQNRYAWRPGYWATAQENWVWNPPHYVWAPRGYVFVDGYYDYPVARRGVLFAPVYFNSSIYSQRGFSYSPRAVINPAVFAAHLFLRPSYGHYYFGDYYGNDYTTSGFSPWFSFSSSRSGYDPLYAHQHWNHRNDRQWSQRVETEFAYRSEHDEARPARTWSDQRDRRTRDTANDDKSFAVAASLEELAKTSDSPIRFQPLDKQEREQIGQRGQQIREAREERRKLEANVASTSTDAPVRNPDNPVRMKLPKTPIVSQPADRLGQDEAPPKALDAPQPDSKIQPQPRRPRGNAVPTGRNPDAPEAEPKPKLPKGDSNQPAADPKPNVPNGKANDPAANPKPRVPKGKTNAPAANPKPRVPKKDLKGSQGDPQPKPPKENPTPELKPVPSIDPTVPPKEDPRPAPPVVVPSPAPPVTPRPDPPGIPPMPEPKATPGAEPARKASKAAPKVTPGAESPRNAPKAAPKVTPGAESPKSGPKAVPKVTPGAESPRNAPKAAPKVTPGAESPRRNGSKAAPKVTPGAESPRNSPQSAPTVTPKP